MKSIQHLVALLAALALSGAGCSSGLTSAGTGGTSTASSGGSPSGGMTGGGGVIDTGGTPGAGGTSVAGGHVNTGGMPGGAGAVAQGGRADTGSSGGRADGGGTPGSAGATSSGGRPGTGGRTGTGTTPGSAGSTGTAGTPGTGGATGGTPSTVPSGDAIPSPGCSATPTTTSACTNTASAPCTIDVDGSKREYYLNLPSGYDGKKPVPVVWEYHPMGGNAKSGITMYGLNSKLTNVIFVSPQGLGSTPGFPNSGGSDEKMTRAINTEIEAKYCTDKSRYFATGFSYGGSMSFTAACNMSDIFRAIGAESGSTVSGATCANKKPARMVAIWATHGDADNVLPMSAATSMIQALAKYNGCTTTTTAVDPSPCVAYQGCQEGFPVVWCVRPGDGHGMPSFASAAITKFFQQFF